MVELVIGNNCSGKTRYLENLVANRRDAVSIDLDEEMLNMIELDEDSLKEVELCLACCFELNAKKTKIVGLKQTASFPRDYGSDEFLNFLTLLCKKVKTIVLDEPEAVLTSHEAIALPRVVETLSDLCEKDVVIATQRKLWFGAKPTQFGTIIDNKFVPVDESEANEVLRLF